MEPAPGLGSRVIVAPKRGCEHRTRLYWTHKKVPWRIRPLPRSTIAIDWAHRDDHGAGGSILVLQDHGSSWSHREDQGRSGHNHAEPDRLIGIITVYQGIAI